MLCERHEPDALHFWESLHGLELIARQTVVQSFGKHVQSNSKWNQSRQLTLARTIHIVDAS